VTPIWSDALGQRSVAQVALLLATAAVAGLARGFSGFGGALIFVPLAGSLVTPQLSAPILLLIDNAAALGLLPRALRDCDRRSVCAMALGALVGVPAGAAALANLPGLFIRWSIAALVVAMLALLISGWRYRGAPNGPVTVAVGVVAGLFSGVAQVSGPPVVAFWLGGRAGAETARGNLIVFFALTSVMATISYWVGGLFPREVLLLAVLTAPFYGLGIALGARMFGLASESAFRRTSYGLIAIAALLSLPVWDGVLR
jgi:uncharacterized protein